MCEDCCDLWYKGDAHYVDSFSLLHPSTCLHTSPFLPTIVSVTKKKLKALSHGHYRAVQCGPKHDMFSQHKHKKHDKSLLPWLVCLGEAGESYHSLRWSKPCTKRCDKLSWPYCDYRPFLFSWQFGQLHYEESPVRDMRFQLCKPRWREGGMFASKISFWLQTQNYAL